MIDEKIEYLGRVISIDTLGNSVTTNLEKKAVLSHEHPALHQHIFKKGWTVYVGGEEEKLQIPEIAEREELLAELKELGRAVAVDASNEDIISEIKLATPDKLTKKERLLKQARDLGIECSDSDSAKTLQEKIQNFALNANNDDSENDDSGNNLGGLNV